MKHIMKKSISMLMALLMLVSLFAGIYIPANAALTVEYQDGSVSGYSNVIKNWGTREEVATFLSPNAIAFYQGTSYYTLAAKAGSADLDKVSTSALYVALYELMSSRHTTQNNYGDTRYLMSFTDIENNGSGSDTISSFYSGKAVGPNWDEGSTWNREHVWPDSKGGKSKTTNSTKSHEADIMMVHPVPSNENSSRGNKAYGGTSTTAEYYYPNLNTTYDVRGDVARTVLYVYVRWGTTDIQEDIKDASGTVIDTVTKDLLDNMWGASGVIESKEVLLTWMEEDPVDTWEMGRNDSVQSITGTRNVFVDYPELAFELFDEEVPEMDSPSGIAKSSGGASGCTHSNTITNTQNPTCEQTGLRTVICIDCGVTVSATVIPPRHNEEEEEVLPTLSNGGYTQLYCGTCGKDLGTENESAPLTKVESWNLTLGSDLSVNFKINVDDSIRNTAKISMKVAGKPTVYPVSELIGTNEEYYLSVKLAAAQMTEDIVVQITNGADKSTAKTYSIKSYAMQIIAGDYPEETKTLVTQMLHYGAAAQTYFNYRLDDMANAGLEQAVHTTPVASNVASYTGKVDGITYDGATMLFKDKIGVRFYFVVDGNVDDYRFTVNGQECSPEKKGERYYIEVANVNPQDMDEQVTVRVNDTLTVVYSPMNFVANMYQKGSEKLQALVQALYSYHMAAEAYLKQ